MNNIIDDLIPRTAEIEAAFKGADDWDGGFNPKYLNELPAVDAAPVVHERWIDNGDGTVRCNWCATWFPKRRESQLQFCGYCGAKMDEKK